MKLKALQYLRYAGKPVQAGEVFECNAADVRVLKAIRKAEDYVESPKRTFMARNVVAEPAIVASSAAQDDPAVERSETATKRAYKRRDLAAE